MIKIRKFTTFCNKGDMKGSDEGLTLETSVVKLFTVANVRYQLSW